MVFYDVQPTERVQLRLVFGGAEVDPSGNQLYLCLFQLHGGGGRRHWSTWVLDPFDNPISLFLHCLVLVEVWFLRATMASLKITFLLNDRKNLLRERGYVYSRLTREFSGDTCYGRIWGSAG